MNYHFNCDDCKNFENYTETCSCCDKFYDPYCKCRHGCVNYSPEENAVFKDTIFCANFEDRVLSILDKQ